MATKNKPHGSAPDSRPCRTTGCAEPRKPGCSWCAPCIDAAMRRVVTPERIAIVRAAIAANTR